MDAIFSPATSVDSSTTRITGRDSLRSLRLAISDPGAFLARGDNYQESLLDWQVRAVTVAIGGSDAGALQAENERLKAELEPYEVLNPQQCSKGAHADWLVDSEHSHACPWCRIAELTVLLEQAQAEARTAKAGA